MQQGKIISVDLLRHVCFAIMQKHTYKDICNLFNIAKTTVQKYKAKLKDSVIRSCEEICYLSNEKLISIIYGDKAQLVINNNQFFIKIKRKVQQRLLGYYSPNFHNYALDYMYKKLTKNDLYAQYVITASELGLIPFKKTAFRKRLNQALSSFKTNNTSLHKEHIYGDELELDWCGQKITLKDEQGIPHNYSILVLTFSASYYTFAYLVEDQTTKTTINALREGFKFFNVYPKQLLIDNPKCLVIKHLLGHEALLNENFRYFMQRCGVMVNANDIFAPNEKSAVEHSVNLIQKRVLHLLNANLSINEANYELQDIVNVKINRAPFRGHEVFTREYIFNNFEKGECRKASDVPNFVIHFGYIKVPVNYHIKIKNNFYSVPYNLVGSYVDVEIDDDLIKIYQDKDLIARHKLKDGEKEFVTNSTHLPLNHQKYFEYNLLKKPSDILKLAKSQSSEVLDFCKAILSRSNEFVEVKKACLYEINKYKELRDKKSTILFNTALKNVLNREEKENLNSYMVDEEYKLLKQFD